MHHFCNIAFRSQWRAEKCCEDLKHANYPVWWCWLWKSLRITQISVFCCCSSFKRWQQLFQWLSGMDSATFTQNERSYSTNRLRELTEQRAFTWKAAARLEPKTAKTLSFAGYSLGCSLIVTYLRMHTFNLLMPPSKSLAVLAWYWFWIMPFLKVTFLFVMYTWM